jgi:signal transduction histidine kinase
VSLRSRLLVTALTTLAIGLGALVAIGNSLLDVRVNAEATSLLRARADAEIAGLAITPAGLQIRETANDDALDQRSWVVSGAHVLERPPHVDPALDSAALTMARAGRAAEIDGPADIRLRARPVRAPGGRVLGTVVVGFSVAPVELLQQEVLAGSLVVAVLVLVAGGVAIRSAVAGALHPVARMTADAEDWSAHDLERRFDLGAPRDELTGLAATLDRLLGRIAASRRHEQRFASEVAHELRTPVSGILGRAQLALEADGPDVAQEREQALRAVIEQATRLDTTIDTLMAVARREIDPEGGTVDLAALAREVPGTEVEIPPGLPPAEGEPEVVRRALAPLVDNARRHARSTVRLVLSGDGARVRIAVRDDGDGVDPRLGERVFDPGVRGEDDPAAGAGLGLPLARRLARSCGGDVRLGAGPGGCFELELPAVQASSSGPSVR